MKSMMIDGEEVVPLSDYAGATSWATRKQVEADGLEEFMLEDTTEGASCQIEGFDWAPELVRDCLASRWFAAASRHAVERDMGQKVRRVWKLVTYIDANAPDGESDLSLVAYGPEGHRGPVYDSEMAGDTQFLSRILPCDQWPGRKNADPKLAELIELCRKREGLPLREGPEGEA
jgi:hypothetical protein